MAGPVVPHKHHIVLVIDRVELGERPAGSESIHDLHGLDVLDFHLACHRNARRTEQAIAKYDGADRIRVR